MVLGINLNWLLWEEKESGVTEVLCNEFLLHNLVIRRAPTDNMCTDGKWKVTLHMWRVFVNLRCRVRACSIFHSDNSTVWAGFCMAGHTAFQLYSINLRYTHIPTYQHTYICHRCVYFHQLHRIANHMTSIGTAGSHVSHTIGAGLQNQVQTKTHCTPKHYIPYNTMQL